MKNTILSLYLATCAVVIFSCAPKPFSASNKTYRQKAKTYANTLKQKPEINGMPWIGTTNFNMRKPNFVVLHHTAQANCEATLNTFTNEKTQVSAHYVICKEGMVHQMLGNYLRGWHAGAAKWGGSTDLNSTSIGIELDNDGTAVYTEVQINALLQLLAQLKKEFTIPTANFIGHGDIAPGRKVDPGANFPWQKLAASGYGLWYADTTNLSVPQNFSVNDALRIIGYDVSNANAALGAFRRHFLASNSGTNPVSEPEKKVLFAVMKQYY